jgi:hypothetical protein
MRVKQESPAERRRSAPRFSGRYCDVTIHADGGIDGKEDVPLGVEGRVLKIKRGERVRIPIEHFEHLKSCAYDTFNNLGDVVGKVPRFAFTFHGEVQEPAVA